MPRAQPSRHSSRPVAQKVPVRAYSDEKTRRLTFLKKEAAGSLMFEKVLEIQYRFLAHKFDECLMHGCQAPEKKCSKQAECIRLACQTHALWKQVQYDTCKLEREIAALELPPLPSKQKKGK